jgi:DNA-binding transcriptional MocR family regulator
MASVASPLTEPVLSAYGARSSEPSAANRMMADFAASYREGVDVNLGVGYVSEETIPRREIGEALLAVLSDPRKYRAALNYGGPAGSANLEASLRDFLRRQGRTPGERRLVVGASGVTSLLEALASVLEPGLVVTSEPLYYIYCDLLRRLGFSLVAIPEDDEGIRPDLLRDCLEQHGEIRFCYVVTVGNPTSRVLTNQRRRELIALLNQASERLGRKIPLVLDEAYELLLHDPALPALESGLSGDQHGIVYELGTLSKVLAPALRIGYLLGLPGPLVDAVVQRTSDIGFSAPLVNQEIASYLLDRAVDEHLVRVREIYRQKALAVRRSVELWLGDALEDLVGGQAGFYYYLTLRDTQTTERSAFFAHATRTTGEPRVLYLPGEHCVDPDSAQAERAARQLRISYGFESLAQIERGIRLLGEALGATTPPESRARGRRSRRGV